MRPVDIDKVVILAAGMGTRMRTADTKVALSPAQAHAAEHGIKALVPVGRPFLDHILTAIADAGFGQVCLVVAPHHDLIRAHCDRLNPQRLRIHFAVQQKPLGTANAVSAAQPFAGDDPFVVINSDNYYPYTALRMLRDATGPAVIGFEGSAMRVGSNIPASRLARFAILDVDANGCLRDVIEKPDSVEMQARLQPVLISMNCWRFDSDIFRACAAIPKSTRNEYELPDAVRHCITQLGKRFCVLPCRETVLDMSSRADVAAVQSILEAKQVRL
jgi:glucose-1-phosphate thymidylyltransferase